MSDTKRNYPTRMHEILEVEPDEVFRLKTPAQRDMYFLVDQQGHMQRVVDDEPVGRAKGGHIEMAINNPEKVIRRPRLTEEQRAA